MRRTTELGLLVVLALAGGPVLAADPPPGHATLAGSSKKHQAVIDDSFIIAARRLPGASLERVKNYADDGDLAAGVSLRYRLDKAPWIVADLFVYPAGEGPADAMLALETKDFHDSVAYAESKGIYTNVWRGSEAPYSIPLADGGTLPGRFLPMAFDSENEMLASRTYLFYRKLYFYKVRMTTGAQAVESLSELADGFTRDVVNGVDVVSTGTCGRQLEIEALPHDQSPPPGYDNDVSEDGYRVLMRLPGPNTGNALYGLQLSQRLELAARRQRGRGCTSLDFPSPQANERQAVVRLHFGPEDWGASPHPENPGR
jgi:hypothetical protein